MLSVAAIANAQPITSFVNLDFDAGVQHFPTGFDNPTADIPGWQNYTTIADSGVEGPGAWWGTYEDHAAFMRTTEGAYNLSDYTIQAGAAFSIEFYAKTWDNLPNGAWTVSLFYDTPANVIGSYTTSALVFGQWNLYSTEITATGASVGGKLGITFLNSGLQFANLDEVTVTAVVPEPASISLVAVAGLGLLLGRRQLAKH